MCTCELYSQALGHQSVFINEPRLSDFKQVLLREGIQAEFVGGVLVCNNMVAVRRVRLVFLLCHFFQHSHAHLEPAFVLTSCTISYIACKVHYNFKTLLPSLSLCDSLTQTEAGRIGLEGCICEDYFRIRELLYQQYAVV